MSVAQFPPASIAAQLAELRRERIDRTSRQPVELTNRRLTQAEADHRNNALDGAIATLETLVRATGQPGRRELIEALRECQRVLDRHASRLPWLDDLLVKVPKE